MTTVFLSLLALHTLGAIGFVLLAKKSSVLVDEDERPIRVPDGLPHEMPPLVRRIETAS